MSLLILFIQDTRSDWQSPQAQDLAQRAGQVLGILVYSLNINILKELRHGNFADFGLNCSEIRASESLNI